MLTHYIFAAGQPEHPCISRSVLWLLMEEVWCGVIQLGPATSQRGPHEWTLLPWYKQEAMVRGRSQPRMEQI